jgi:hypothetical protein
MLISQLIQKLEKMKSEKGDLPVYTERDFEVCPLQTVVFRTLVEENREYESDLKLGQPYVCAY